MKTQTIQATVNARLLSKASRLFTGSVEGRIIEILQNARRAGATQVQIHNRGNLVVVEDNGRGIEDFAKLLDLGGSGWSGELEASEDPAGVGLFCLAPREVNIRSNGKIVRIKDNGWTGEAVEVLEDDPPQGTLLCFPDSPWEPAMVNPRAVFSGMQVFVDGKECPRFPFVSDAAMHYPELGCRIEVCNYGNLSEWHSRIKHSHSYSDNVLVNFHGQVVAFVVQAVSDSKLRFLVELTGEPTGIRLMLPARTRLVENEALVALKNALELEAYRFIERRGEHELPYKDFLRAKQLGINLPEAKLTYTIGLLKSAEYPEPIEIQTPKDFPLEKCYRFLSESKKWKDMDASNIHLLAALGKLAAPFVPVEISSQYDGYSWAKLATANDVSVQIGTELHKSWLWSGTIVCVDAITITATTSDGQTFSAPVCMVVQPADEEHQWADSTVFVTRQARERLYANDIWYHVGGYNEEGDTYDTQESQFSEELDRFWAEVVGPDEHLRQGILKPLDEIEPAWQSVTVTNAGAVTIHFEDGSTKKIQPPEPGTSMANS